MNFSTEIIRNKRDGKALTPEEIAAFVNGMVDGSVASEQVSAMAMAVYFNGMTFSETCAMTLAMARTGTIFDWSSLGIVRPTVDKHSTGGVGDKVSMILVPILVACGAIDPMIAGRGLGHTGGTLDKLESIPGFDVNLSRSQFIDQVRRLGAAIIGQTEEMVPADRRFYAIRDVTETVESIPLITASILSKKIAAGPEHLVIDLKVGTGAFMSTVDDARRLAESLILTAGEAGVHTECILTDMNQVLGRTAGNALEIQETVEFLNGDDREERLHAVTVALATNLLISSKLAQNIDDAATKIEDVLNSGEAFDVFGQIVAAQGGPADFIHRSNYYLESAPVTLDVTPDKVGYIAAMDTRNIGNVIVDLGGGRSTPNDAIDFSVGLSECRGKGDQVGPTSPICRVHAKSRDDAHNAAQRILGCVDMTDLPHGSSRMVIEALGPGDYS